MRSAAVETVDAKQSVLIGTVQGDEVKVLQAFLGQLVLVAGAVQT